MRQTRISVHTTSLLKTEFKERTNITNVLCFYVGTGCAICFGPLFKSLRLEKRPKHPWAREDLSLKIDEHDQTIWNCTLES